MLFLWIKYIYIYNYNLQFVLCPYSSMFSNWPNIIESKYFILNVPVLVQVGLQIRRILKAPEIWEKKKIIGSYSS